MGLIEIIIAFIAFVGGLATGAIGILAFLGIRWRAVKQEYQNGRD